MSQRMMPFGHADFAIGAVAAFARQRKVETRVMSA